MHFLAIDNAAHMGGSGWIYFGQIYDDRQADELPRKTKSLRTWLVCGIILLASFVLMILHFRDPLPL